MATLNTCIESQRPRPSQLKDNFVFITVEKSFHKPGEQTPPTHTPHFLKSYIFPDVNVSRLIFTEHQASPSLICEFNQS